MLVLPIWSVYAAWCSSWPKCGISTAKERPSSENTEGNLSTHRYRGGRLHEVCCLAALAPLRKIPQTEKDTSETPVRAKHTLQAPAHIFAKSSPPECCPQSSPSNPLPLRPSRTPPPESHRGSSLEHLRKGLLQKQ